MLTPDRSGRAPPAIAARLEQAGGDARPQDTAVVAVRNCVSMPLLDGVRASFITHIGLAPGVDHFAARFGSIAAGTAPLVRIHSGITGDVFGSLRCDCGAQLAQTVDTLQASGGFLLYLRQEGRGTGLGAKLDACGLQDRGLDTCAAKRALSLPADARDCGVAAAMLRALDVTRVRLISNNPDKAEQLARHGIEVVERVPTGTFMTMHDRGHLEAKAAISGHRGLVLG